MSQSIIDYMVHPLKRGTLRRRVAAHLHDAILHGELRPGERIVEGKLARELRVAQGTLREALQELEHQGLVTKHDHRGTFVSELTTREIEDIYVVRCALEPIAAALARERLTPDHLAQMTSLVEKMKSAGEAHDFVELLKTDLAFHRLIWKLSGNGPIERALNVVCPPVFACYLIKASSGDPYNRAKDLEQHRTLVNAFETGSSEEVKKVFEEMMDVFRVQDVGNFEAREVDPRPSSGRDDNLPAQP